MSGLNSVCVFQILKQEITGNLLKAFVIDMIDHGTIFRRGFDLLLMLIRWYPFLLGLNQSSIIKINVRVSYPLVFSAFRLKRTSNEYFYRNDRYLGLNDILSLLFFSVNTCKTQNVFDMPCRAVGMI